MPRISLPQITRPSITTSTSSNTEPSSREPLLPSGTNAGSGPTGLVSGLFSRRSITLEKSGPASSKALKQACKAAKSGDAEKLQELLRKDPSLLTETGERGNSLLTLSVENATSTQTLLFLAQLLCLEGFLRPEAMAAIVNHRNHDGNTTLALALKSGNLEAAKVLLKEPSIDLRSANNNDQTALHLAASTTPEIVTLLLQHPTAQACLPEILNRRDHDGITAFSVAVRSTKPKIAEILLQQPGIDVNLADNDQRTPLHIATIALAEGVFDSQSDAKPKEKLLNLLLKHPSIQANLPDKSGDTPLHVCIKHVSGTERSISILTLSSDHAGCGWRSVPLLANSPKVDPNQRDANGKTPLELAMDDCWRVSYNYSLILESIEALLANANITPNCPDKDKITPVWHAVHRVRDSFGMSDRDKRDRYTAPFMALLRSPKVDLNSSHNGQTIIEYLLAFQPPSGWARSAQVDSERKRDAFVEMLLRHPRWQR